jgi:hypothetical protein
MAKRKRVIDIDTPQPTPSEALAEVIQNAPLVPASSLPVPESHTPHLTPPSELTNSAEPSSTEAAQDKPSPRPQVIRSDYPAGVRLLENRRFKQMQFAFTEKPSEEARQLVRDAGYQWRSVEQVWTKQIDTEQAWQTRAQANELFTSLAEQLRIDKGIGQEVS